MKRFEFTRRSFAIAITMAAASLLFVVPFSALSSNKSIQPNAEPYVVNYPHKKSVISTPAQVRITEYKEYKEYKSEESGTFLHPPKRTNFLFIGLDNNLLADALMVGTLYSETGDIRLMSIPRDMYTYIPPNRIEQMHEDGLRIPKELKINAVRAFGGRLHGVKYLKAQLGEMLGVHFHYYVEVELAAFKRIVDAIGGVSMHISQDLKYSDPYQNLFIDIPAGYHHLNGDMAEGVVRYRGFITGDLMRNTMQAEFMSQLIKQSITRDAIMNDPLTLASTILSDISTNASVLEMAKYLPYIGQMNMDGVSTYTLPGAPEYRNGVSWFIPDTQMLPDVVAQVFYGY